MMRRECRRLHSNLKQSVYIFFAQSIGYAIMNFGYQFFTTFTGSPIINSDMLILNHFFIFINGLLFVLGENRYQNKMTDMFPAFYKDKTFGPRKSLIHYLFELLMTFLESVWILYFTIFTYYSLRN